MRISDLLPGDLLFMADSSDFARAIIGTTADYSHVGIHFDGLLYHASRKKGVAKEKLTDYLKDEHCSVAVYRCPSLQAEAVKARAEAYIGLPYNHSFYPEDRGFYCSQYIAAILPVFGTVPMKFGDGKREISAYWKEYYEALGLKVPLNMPGTNPGQLAQSDKLAFVGALDY